MAEVRACLYFGVILMCFHVIAGKPIFDFLWCDLACDDDDVSTSSTTSAEDYYDWFSCDSCPRRRRTTTPAPMFPGMPQQAPFNLMMPPGNGMNVSISNVGGSYWFGLNPWAAPAPATAAPGGAAGAPAAPAAAAAATTAAPATTAAAGAATTAAATTAAPAG